MKNIDYINKIVAKKSQIPEDTIKKVNSFFWKEIRQEIYSHEETSIFIRGLGTFSHSLKKVRTEILWLVRRIKGLRHSKKYVPKVRDEIIENYKKYFRTLLKHKNILVLHYITLNKLQKARREQNRKMAGDSEVNTESA